MNIKSCEKREKSEAEIVVEINTEEFDSAIGKAYIKIRNQIAVPGFRKGKAPRKIIEKMYGATVFHSDALDALIPSVMKTISEESGLRIIGFPQVTDVNIQDGNNGADITVAVAVYPEITLGEYKGLSAVKPAVEAPESEIDSEIAGMRLRNARIEKADRPAINGDVAVIDYEGFVDGEPFEGGKGADYELELGSGSFIPGFEEKIQGMTAGEQRDLELVFPDNYAEHLAGKPVVFKVKLNELKEKILPELDDEFAKDVSEFDTLDEYRADIREKLMKSRQTDADAIFENALMDKVVEAMEAEIPDAMIETQMDNSVESFARRLSTYGMDPAAYFQAMKVSPETFRENMRESSEKQVRVMLALEKIAEVEGIEISAEDIENEYKELAERYSMEVDKLKESVREEDVMQDLKVRRAAKVVVDSASAESAPESETNDAPEPEDEKADDGTGDEGAVPQESGEESGTNGEQAEQEAEKTETLKKPAARKPKKPAEPKAEGEEVQ